MVKRMSIWVVLFVLLFSAELSAQDKSSDSDDLDAQSSTTFNFDAATLEGKMKAPPGLMLKGRVEQNKSQMVQLRKDFRPELRKSVYTNQAIKPRN